MHNEIMSGVQLVDFLIITGTDITFISQLEKIWRGSCSAGHMVSQELIDGAEELLKKYSEDELYLMKLRSDGKNLREIAQVTGISHVHVGRLCNKYANRIIRCEECRRMLTEGKRITRNTFKYMLISNATQGFIDEETANIPLSRLGLSVRTYHALIKNGLRTVGDVAGLNRKEIEGLRQVREKAREDVCAALWKIGVNAGAWQKGITEMPEEIEHYIKEHPDQIPLEKLNISNRTYRALNKAGFLSAADVLRVTPKEILDIKGIGKAGTEEIYMKLSEMGFLQDSLTGEINLSFLLESAGKVID